MGFINERTSKEDRIEYGLDEIENSVPRGVWHPGRDWTIDKERKIYLRQIWQSNSGSEAEISPKFIDRKYHFFIDNILYQVQIRDDLEQEIMTKEGYLKSFLTVASINPLQNDNDELVQIIKTLYEALLIRKSNGIYSNWIKKFDLTLIYQNLEMKNTIISNF
ncbi:hypothetical protein ACG94X_15480 [Acinetobacter sp. ULE_I010]|uniref:hypothetical protein n=1 Tax=Acinetobacter sp. ULE_I010 TaxID=3373065 RepID=UPI003AF96A9B